MAAYERVLALPLFRRLGREVAIGAWRVAKRSVNRATASGLATIPCRWKRLITVSRARRSPFGEQERFELRPGDAARRSESERREG